MNIKSTSWESVKPDPSIQGHMPLLYMRLYTHQNCPLTIYEAITLYKVSEQNSLEL